MPTAVAITPTTTPIPTALPTATAAAPTSMPEAQLPELPRLENGRMDDPTFPETLQGRVTRIEYVADDNDGRWLAYDADDNIIAYTDANWQWNYGITDGRVDDPSFPEKLQGQVVRIVRTVDGEGEDRVVRWTAYGVEVDAEGEETEVLLAERSIGEKVENAGEWESLVEPEQLEELEAFHEIGNRELLQRLLPNTKSGEYLMPVGPESGVDGFRAIIASSEVMPDKKIVNLVIEPYLQESIDYAINIFNTEGLTAAHAETGEWQTFKDPDLVREIIVIYSDVPFSLPVERDGYQLTVNPRFEGYANAYQLGTVDGVTRVEVPLYNPDTKQVIYYISTSTASINRMIEEAPDFMMGRIFLAMIANLLLSEEDIDYIRKRIGVLDTLIQYSNKHFLEFTKIAHNSPNLKLVKNQDGTYNITGMNLDRGALRFNIIPVDN
jgi:hypothetical protein